MSRILLISHIFPPAIDGGSRVIFKLGQYLEFQNHQILYLSSDCSSTDDFTQTTKTPCPVKVHRYPGEGRRVGEGFYLPVYHHLRRPLKFINLFIHKRSYLYGLLKIFQKGPIFKIIPFFNATIKIIKFNPDLIIAGPLPTTIILYANFLKKITSISKSIKSFPSFLQRRGLRGRFCPKLLINASFHQTDSDFHQKPLIKTLQQADYLWTLTQYETDYFINNFNIDPQKIVLAGNGIDPSFLKKSEAKKSTIYHLPTTILFIGSLSAHKGIDTLIKSFSTIYNLRPIKLILAGQKTLYYPQIQKQINQLPKNVQSKIKFIFDFPQNDLSKLIDKSSFLVLPSQQESFGLVLIEAWARSKPVITSDIPVLKEMIQKTQGGITFKTNQATDLSCQILNLIDHPETCQQLGQNGFNYVKNNYTWPIIRKKIFQRISLSA